MPAMNNLLHALYNVFIDRPSDTRRQLISAKKIQQGDATPLDIQAVKVKARQRKQQKQVQ